MTIIGLTGGIACGKSTVAGWLRQEGATVIDADGLSRELTAKGGAALPLIRQAFGDGVFTPDGALDRAKLGDRVFGDKGARERLNGIVHPLIRRRMEEDIENCRKKGVSTVVLDVPLLYEAGLEALAHWVACVSAPEELQIWRLKTRDGLSREQALARVQSQWPLEEKERRADEVIRTDRPMEEVRAQALQMYRRFAKGAKNDPIASDPPKR